MRKSIIKVRKAKRNCDKTSQAYNKALNALNKACDELRAKLKDQMKYCRTADEFGNLVSKLPNIIKTQSAEAISHYMLVMKIHDILGRRKLSRISMVKVVPIIQALIENAIQEYADNNPRCKHAKISSSEKITFMLIWMYRYGWVNRYNEKEVEVTTIRRNPTHLVKPFFLIIQDPCGPVGARGSGYCLYCCCNIEKFISASKALMER